MGEKENQSVRIRPSFLFTKVNVACIVIAECVCKDHLLISPSRKREKNLDVHATEHFNIFKKTKPVENNNLFESIFMICMIRFIMGAAGL